MLRIVNKISNFYLFGRRVDIALPKGRAMSVENKKHLQRKLQEQTKIGNAFISENHYLNCLGGSIFDDVVIEIRFQE